MESAEKKQMCVRLMIQTCKVKKISREVKGDYQSAMMRKEVRKEKR